MRKWIAWLLIIVSLLQFTAIAEIADLQINAQQIVSTNNRTAVRTAYEVYFVLPSEGGEMLVRMPLDGSAPVCVDRAEKIEDLVAFNNGVAYLKTANGATSIENCLGNSVATVYSFGTGSAQHLSVYGSKLLVLIGGLLHSIEPDTALCLKLAGAQMLDYVIGDGYAYFIAGGDQIEYTAQLDADTNIAVQAGCLYRLNLNSGENELMLKSGVEDLDTQNHFLYFHNLADAYAVRTADATTLCGRVYSLDAQMMTLEGECEQPDSGFWPLTAGLVAWYDGALNMETEAGVLALYTPEAGASVFSDGEVIYIWEPGKQALTEARANGNLVVLYNGDLSAVQDAPKAPVVSPTPEASEAPTDADPAGNSDWFENFMNNASNATGNDYTSSGSSSGLVAQPTPIGQPTPTPAPNTGSTGGSSSSGSSSSGSSSSGSSSSGSSSSGSSSSSSGKDSSYIFASSHKKKLTESQVRKLDPSMLGYARNEIYARHGYQFKNSKYAKYFAKKSWYKPGGFSTGDLNSIEWYNMELIKKIENEYAGKGSSSGSSSSSGKTVKIVGGNCNIRSKPDKTSKSLGYINEGKKATYLGKSSTDSRGVKWYKIEYKGVTGWVSSKYSKVQ